MRIRWVGEKVDGVRLCGVGRRARNWRSASRLTVGGRGLEVGRSGGGGQSGSRGVVWRRVTRLLTGEARSRPNYGRHGGRPLGPLEGARVDRNRGLVRGLLLGLGRRGRADEGPSGGYDRVRSSQVAVGRELVAEVLVRRGDDGAHFVLAVQ